MTSVQRISTVPQPQCVCVCVCVCVSHLAEALNIKVQKMEQTPLYERNCDCCGEMRLINNTKNVQLMVHLVLHFCVLFKARCDSVLKPMHVGVHGGKEGYMRLWDKMKQVCFSATVLLHVWETIVTGQRTHHFYISCFFCLSSSKKFFLIIT